MKKITFLLGILLITLLTTSSIFAQANITGKWRMTKLDAKPEIGQAFTEEQVKNVVEYKKKMFLRLKDIVWSFEESTYAIIGVDSQEPLEVGTYTIEGENEFLMIRKYLTIGQEDTQHSASVKGNQLIIEVIANADKGSGIDKLVFTLDR